MLPVNRRPEVMKLAHEIDEATCDTVTTGHDDTKINHCAVICDDDRNFGSVDVIHTDQFQKSELVPSQRVDLMTLSHFVSRAEDQTSGSVRSIFRVLLWKTWIFLS